MSRTRPLLLLLAVTAATACGGSAGTGSNSGNGSGSDGGSVAPPGAPTGVTASAGDGAVSISWTSVSGASSYDLYWSTASSVSKSSGTKVAGVTSGAAVTGLTDGTVYYFVVTALNSAGESAESAVVTATPLPLPPGAPTGVTAVAGDGQVTVSWSGSTGATSYDLYWSTSSSVSRTNGTKVSGASSGAAVTGLTDGTTYYFVVTAVDLGGESAESTVASATPLPPVPAAPTNVSAVPGDRQVAVSWSAASGATSYKVYCSTTGPSSLCASTSGATSANITGLLDGTTYQFVVTAVNLGGESAGSTPVSATPVAPPPAPPTGVTAVAADFGASVSWTASSGATSYDVYWSTSASVSKASGTRVAGATSGGLVGGLPAGTPCYFVVTALSAAGESAESSPVATATPLPALVGSVGYTGASGAALSVNSNSQVVYIASGVGQHGLLKIDASNPASMSPTPLFSYTSYGGGVAVDPATGQYATTNGSSTLTVLTANDSYVANATLAGLGGAFTVDPGSRQFFVSTQGGNAVGVYNENSNSLTTLPVNGVGSTVVFDPSTYTIYENLTPNYSLGVNGPAVIHCNTNCGTPGAAWSTSYPIQGIVLAADPSLKRLYVNDNAGNTQVLDGSSFAPLKTFPGSGISLVAADTSLGRFYAVSGKTITVYDASSFSPLATLTLPGNLINLQMVAGDKRLYALDSGNLYVIQTR